MALNSFWLDASHRRSRSSRKPRRHCDHERAGDSDAVSGAEPNEGRVVINEVDADCYRNVDFSEFLTLKARKLKDMDNEEELAKVDYYMTDTDADGSKDFIKYAITEMLKTHIMTGTGRLLYRI